MRQLFGSEGPSAALDDIEDEDTLDYIFGQSKLTVGEGGTLKVLKPKPIDIEDNDRRRMYRAHVLEGTSRWSPFPRLCRILSLWTTRRPPAMVRALWVWIWRGGGAQWTRLLMK